MSTNQRLASLFQQMAEVMQILGADGFRINAYQKVSRVLDELATDVASVGPDIKKLTEFDGIGKGSAERIAEYLKTGKIKDYEELMAKIPPGLPALLAIQGLGPKTIALLWKEAGVDSLEKLREKLEGDELSKLPGMGAKKLDNLRKSVQFAETSNSGQRVRIGVAMPIATWFVEQIEKMPGAKRVQYAGSLRRGKETIGDIDILVAAEDADAAVISDAFVKLKPVGRILAHGPTKSSIQTTEEIGQPIQVDLRVIPPAKFGAALMYFTGSKEHNVAMRERAIRMGLKLNEYALAKEPGGTVVAAATEEEVFEALGLAWVPPEMREDKGELSIAEGRTFPKLVEFEQIRAELHAHTTASDGRWSIRELALEAHRHGFHTIAITDHSKSSAIANGLSEERLEEHIKAVHHVAAELKATINILAGSEVDILADGTLDYPDSLLKELDIVVASPHAALTQEPEKATARLLKAIENPYVTIIGHPTGRIVLKREGISPDMDRIIRASKERGIALEINANSLRLDLRDTHARAAIEAGVKLAIDTDAHGPGDMEQLMYGVLTARRAGATAGDVVNCMSREGLAAWIKSTRR